MTVRLCLDCRRYVDEVRVERRDCGGWWCRWWALCCFEAGDVALHVAFEAAEAAEAKHRGLHVETVGTTADGGTVWEVRR